MIEIHDFESNQHTLIPIDKVSYAFYSVKDGKHSIKIYIDSNLFIEIFPKNEKEAQAWYNNIKKQISTHENASAN